MTVANASHLRSGSHHLHRHCCTHSASEVFVDRLRNKNHFLVVLPKWLLIWRPLLANRNGQATNSNDCCTTIFFFFFCIRQQLLQHLFRIGKIGNRSGQFLNRCCIAIRKFFSIACTCLGAVVKTTILERAGRPLYVIK